VAVWSRSLLRCMRPDVALLGPQEMSDLSPQSGPKRTLIKRAAVSSAAAAVTCRTERSRIQAIGRAVAAAKPRHRLHELRG
jgi:hypothetical protein